MKKHYFNPLCGVFFLKIMFSNAENEFIRFVFVDASKFDYNIRHIRVCIGRAECEVGGK